MLRRYKLIILISVMLLVPILVGIIPLNMAHMLASVDHFVHGKQGCWKNHCPFHSLISRDDPNIVNLNVTPLDQESTPTFDIHVLDPDSTHSNITFNSVPLRC